MATTVVQATEHILIESATAVVTSIGTAAVGETKTVENALAKEAVAATDDDPSNILDKLEDGLAVVAEEVAKGAEAAVEAVEAHPELIAEGALAVVIGAASLIQPELAVGGVALIGKMAADSAKKTVQTIATDTGSNVVKAISKDLADDATAETAKDAAAAKVKADNEAAKDPKATTSDNEAPPPPVAKDSSTNAIHASASLDPKPTAIPTTGAPGDKTVSIEVASEDTKATNLNSADANAEHTTAPPVSLKITIGADGEVKAVSQELKSGDGDASKSITAEEISTTRAAATNSGKLADATTKELALDASNLSAETSKGHPLVATAKDVPSARAAVVASVTKATTTEELCVTHQKSSSDEPIELIPGNVKDTTPPLTAESLPNDSTNEAPLERGSTNTELLGHSENVFTTRTSVAIAAVASVAKTTKTTTTTTSEVPADPAMVMISQESLDNLHLKIDTMHEAIQEITKLLALHLPRKGAPLVEPNNKNVINAPWEESGRTDEFTTSIFQSPLDGQSQIILEGATHIDDSPPKRPVAQKRTSMLGAIGKVIWPFGGSPLIDTPPTQDNNPQLLAPNLIKAPTVTTSEILCNGPEIGI